jgi:hypothetical protein
MNFKEIKWIKVIMAIYIIVIIAFIYNYVTERYTLSENMAPIGYGSFKNDYPYGKCNTGSFERTSCMTGNCPLQSTITNEQYCDIQCAQDPDAKLRKDCTKSCMKQMINGCR